eukprot:COSAG05_NODE_14396_length_398_cov_0.635452_1_plen_64_part_01
MWTAVATTAVAAPTSLLRARASLGRTVKAVVVTRTCAPVATTTARMEMRLGLTVVDLVHPSASL